MKTGVCFLHVMDLPLHVAAHPASMVRIRDAHFYRKVPKDVTEATKLGGIVSVIAMFTIAWLIKEEYAGYATLKRTTELRLDQTAMASTLSTLGALHSPLRAF